MLTFSLISLVYTLPAVALIALMRSPLLPDYLKTHRWLAMSLEAVLWVAGVQVMSEGVLLSLAFDLMRPGATETGLFNNTGAILRTLAAVPVFALPLLVRLGPMTCLFGSLLWAVLLGHSGFIEYSTGLVIDKPLASVDIGLFVLTPITLTYFLVGALWVLSVQRSTGHTQVHIPPTAVHDSTLLTRRQLIGRSEALASWSRVFGLYVWIAFGLVLASAGLMSNQSSRVDYYGLVMIHNLGSILTALWMLSVSNQRIQDLLDMQEKLSKRQINGLENHVFMRQQQICRMLSAAGAGAVFWQARHAHVLNGSQEWRTGLVEYRLNALQLHLPVRASDNLEIFFRKCLPVSEFDRVAQAMDSIFKGDQSHFALELEGAQNPGGKRNYKLFANALRSQDGLGILFLDMLMIDYSQEKALRHRLADSAEARRDTLFSVGHDLGSPLGLIRIATSILRRHLERGQKADEVTSRQISRIESCVKEADAYLKNAIDFAQSDNPDHVYPFGELPVGTWIHELVDAQRSIYGIDASAVRVDVDARLVLRDIQVQPFQMLVTNLVSNAFKYGASPGESVSLRVNIDAADATAPHVVVDVADRGSGIPPSVRQSLFQPFRRGDNAGEIKGCGLGLAIVRRAALCMKAQIDLLPVDKGTHFRIRIPLPDSTLMPMACLPEKPSVAQSAGIPSTPVAGVQAGFAATASTRLNAELPPQALPFL